jgi:hypothetical protein
MPDTAAEPIQLGALSVRFHVADVIAGGGTPDVEKIGEVMSRHCRLQPHPPSRGKGAR